MAEKKHNTKTKPKWEPVPGMTPAYQWGKASCWKGKKGWWASRGGDAIQGPFRGHRKAMAWAEEPFHEANRKREEARAKKAQAKADLREAAAKRIWGDLPPESRQIAIGQVWRMKAHPEHEVLVVEIRQRPSTLVVLTSYCGEPWDPAKRDVRDPAALPRLFHYIGTSRIPKPRKRA